MRQGGPRKGKPLHPLTIVGLIIIMLLAVWLMFGPPMALETMLWLNAVMVACVVGVVIVARHGRK